MNVGNNITDMHSGNVKRLIVMGTFAWRVFSLVTVSFVLLLAWSWPSTPVRSIPSGDRPFSERNLRAEGYDYIVVGSGPAGCAFVARLAQQLESARPSILLLEAGPDGRDDIQSRDAGQWINLNYRTNSKLDWGYQTYLAGHGKWSNYQRGKALGGSAAINVQMWVLGDPKDWDDFANVIPSGNWRWSSIQPLYMWLNGLFLLFKFLCITRSRILTSRSKVKSRRALSSREMQHLTIS
jgi:hypothetical protein